MVSQGLAEAIWNGTVRIHNPNQADPEFYMYINKAPLSEDEVDYILSNVEKGLTVQFDQAMSLETYQSVVNQLTKADSHE